MIDPASITGLVLAGGAGRRLGGLDKGLQRLRGQALAQQVARRLAPQVAEVWISANRHLDEYRRLGHRVIVDRPASAGDSPRFDGPLAGLHAGLAANARPWLVAVPCDAPALPTDLVARLGQAAAEHSADVAVAETIDADGTLRMHPSVVLVATACGDSLAAFLARGERKARAWVAGQRHVVVRFDDAAAFANLNTPQDLARAEALDPAALLGAEPIR